MVLDKTTPLAFVEWNLLKYYEPKWQQTDSGRMFKAFATNDHLFLLKIIFSRNKRCYFKMVL